MNINRTIVSGLILDDIEKHTTKSGKIYCNFEVTCQITEDKEEAYPCQAWGDIAEYLSKEIKRGDTILVDGRIRLNYNDEMIIMASSITKFGEMKQEPLGLEDGEEELTPPLKEEPSIQIPDTSDFPAGGFRLKDMNTDDLPFY